MAQIGAADLTDSQRMALALARSGETLTNGLYRQAAGLDSRVVTRELGDLVGRGYLEPSGTGRWTTYRLAGEHASQTQKRRRDRRGEIVALLAVREEASRAEIAEALGLTDANARWWLDTLRREGLVAPTTVPRSRNARYRLVT